jgi:hypothetical protein
MPDQVTSCLDDLPHHNQFVHRAQFAFGVWTVDETVDKCALSGDKTVSYAHLLENFGLSAWFNGCL